MRAALLLVYITCADEHEALRIGRALVERRLAACVNLRPHTAIYRWGGNLETAAEFGLIAKTSSARFPALRDFVCAAHSYTLPCIVALPIAAGHEPYLDWVEAELGG